VPEIVEALKAYQPDTVSPMALVFPNGIPCASRLKMDAKRNGIEYQDESGRCAGFHALRYTWATFLQRNDVPQRFAVKLMRLSDIKRTSKVYTDETQLTIYAAIKGLPRLKEYTQIRAETSGAECLKTCRKLTRRAQGRKLMNPRKWRCLSRVGAGGRKWKNWSERRDSNPDRSLLSSSQFPLT